MAYPSEVLDLAIRDLLSIAVLAHPGKALESSLPVAGSGVSMAIGWPELLEQTDPARPGNPRTPSELILTFRFPFVAGFRDQSQGRQGDVYAAGLRGTYDTGARIRGCFLGGAAVWAVVHSVVVQRVVQSPPAPAGQLSTYSGSFDLVFRTEDGSHILGYQPSQGYQPNQEP